MSSILLRTPTVHALLHVADIYRFEGHTFEHHRYLGPTPLTRKGEPARRIRSTFWAAYARWEKLTLKQRERTRV